MIRFFFICFIFLSGSVYGYFSPENGLYWNPHRPANFYAIDYQVGKMAFVVYSYNEQGAAEWFTASGPLVQVTGGDEFPAARARFSAPLARLAGGLPIGTTETVLDTSRAYRYPTGTVVGQVQIEFIAEGVINAFIVFGDRMVSEPLEPFNFGYGTVGRNDFISWRPCWQNYSGEWVFVDRRNPTRPAWRFTFGQPEVSVWDENGQPTTLSPSCMIRKQSHLLIYRDLNSDAYLRCVYRDAEVYPEEIPDDAEGCELVDGDQILFSSFVLESDRQLKRLLAWPGPAKDVSVEQIISDPTGPTIQGLRVQ